MGGDGKQKLTLETEVKGAEQAAKNLERVSKAQKGIGDQSKVAATQTTKVAEAQDKLNASESDFIGVLTQVNPALGQFADGLLKSFKISGDLASKQIDLRGVLGTATQAIKGNAAALKLIGAGGAVVVGILAIASAVRKEREEHERNVKAIREEIDAQNELAKLREAQKAQAERRSAASREGPLSAEGSERAQLARDRLAKSVPFTSDEARANAVALAGPDASARRLEDVAIALDQPVAGGGLDVDQLLRSPPDRRSARLDRFVGQRSSDIARIREREAVQQAETIRRAMAEIGAQGGSTAAIQSFISTLPGGLGVGVDGEKLAQTVAALPGASFDKVGLTDVPGLLAKSVADTVIRGQGGTFVDLEARGSALAAEGVAGAMPALIRQAEIVLQLLGRAAEKLERAADSAGGVTINAPNGKFIGRDATSQRSRIRNGQTRAEDASRRILGG